MAEASGSNTTAPVDTTVTNAANPNGGADAMIYEPVADGQSDIAKTVDGEQMKTEATGRVPFQKVYLWTGSNDGNKKPSASTTTNKQYKAAEDGPDVAGKPAILPTDGERAQGNGTREYMEVGLIIGADPYKYKPEKGGRDPDRKKQMEKRAVLNRDPGAMRVFIPIVAYQPEQSKYYVGVDPHGGHLEPRIADGNVIFFYPEFWKNCPEKANKRDRLNFVNRATKWHSAINKNPANRNTAAITQSEMDKRTSYNPLVVSRSENLINTMVLQFSLIQETRDPEWVKGLIAAMNEAGPDLKVSPYTSQEGIRVFYEFEDLSEEEARMVARELKAAVPAMPDLSSGLIQAVHYVVKENDWHGRLPYSSLACFLELCHKAIPEKSSKEFTKAEVARALDVIGVMNKHGLAWRPSSVQRISKDDYHQMLTTVKGLIDGIIVFAQGCNKALAEQHGGILKHASIKDIMNKVGNAIDQDTLKNLFEQLGVLHGIQYAASNNQVCEELETLSKTMGRKLSASTKE